MTYLSESYRKSKFVWLWWRKNSCYFSMGFVIEDSYWKKIYRILSYESNRFCKKISYWINPTRILSVLRLQRSYMPELAISVIIHILKPGWGKWCCKLITQLYQRERPLICMTWHSVFRLQKRCILISSHKPSTTTWKIYTGCVLFLSMADLSKFG